MSNPNIKSLYDTVVRLMHYEATENAKNLLSKLHPSDIAEIIRMFPEPEQDAVLSLVFTNDNIHDIFCELGSKFLTSYISKNRNFDELTNILQRLPSDDLAKLLAGLPDEMSQELLGRLQAEQSQEITGLLQYQEKTAGSLMSTELFQVKHTVTVGEAIRSLQRSKKAVTIFYVYVVDEFGTLVGVASIRQLFQVEAARPIREIMLRDVLRVRVDDKQEEVARLIAQYDVVALPVVDSQNKLVGVITVDDVIDVIKEEAQESVLKMASAEAASVEGQSFGASLRRGLPGFVALLVGAIATCEVITFFYQSLPPVGIFAGFIPLILRFSGIVCRQTATLTIHALGSGDGRRQIVSGIVRHHGGIILLVAVSASLATALYAYFRFQSVPYLPAAVAVSLFVSMGVAVILGLVMPFVFKWIRLDPVWATGPYVNFLLDVLSLFVYFKALFYSLTLFG